MSVCKINILTLSMNCFKSYIKMRISGLNGFSLITENTKNKFYGFEF